MIRWSAFGVVHTLAKAQIAPGVYGTYLPSISHPTVTPDERHNLRSDLRHRKIYDPTKAAGYQVERHQAETGIQRRQWEGRKMRADADVLSSPAGPEPPRLRGTGRRAHTDAKRDAMAEPTTPSAVHRNVEYGASVDPRTRAHLDSTLDPADTKRLRNKVVFHHQGENHYTTVASAVPPHVTTGGKGHVFMNRKQIGWTLETDEPGGAKSVLGHELVHATSTSGYHRRTMLQAAGEEARADARSGTDAYIKAGHIPVAALRKPVTPHQASRMRLTPAATLKVPTGSRFSLDEIKRYGQVHGTVTAAMRRLPK